MFTFSILNYLYILIKNIYLNSYNNLKYSIYELKVSDKIIVIHIIRYSIEFSFSLSKVYEVSSLYSLMIKKLYYLISKRYGKSTFWVDNARFKNILISIS